MKHSAARKGPQSLIQGLEEAADSAVQHTQTKASDRHFVGFDFTSLGPPGVMLSWSIYAGWKDFCNCVIKANGSRQGHLNRTPNSLSAFD